MTEEELLKLAQPLISEDQRNADYVINALRKVPDDEREELVLLMTDPKNKLIDEERKNVKDVIEAFSEFRSLEKEIRKSEKKLISMKRKMKASPFCKLLTNLE